MAHFAQLHAEWAAQGRSHAGVVVSSQRPIGDVLRRLLRLARTLDAAALHSRLEYLGGW